MSCIGRAKRSVVAKMPARMRLSLSRMRWRKLSVFSIGRKVRGESFLFDLSIWNDM